MEGRPRPALLLPAAALALVQLAVSPAALRTPEPERAALQCNVLAREPEGESAAVLSRQPRWCPSSAQRGGDCAWQTGPESHGKLVKDFWATTQCPLTLAALASAYRPRGHEGARLRLRKKLRKMEHRPVNVTVIGNSMTYGRNSKRSWPERLADLVQDLDLPMHVRNLGRPGTNSQWAAYRPDSASHYSDADIVLIDYGLTDRQALLEEGDASLGLSVESYYRDLVEMLAELPNKPAIVDIQTFDEVLLDSNRPSLNRDEGSSEQPTDNCKRVDVTKFHHWPVNKELNVPVISYTEAVCHSKRTFWMSSNSGADRDDADITHPGLITHDLLAHIVMGFFLDELGTVCSKGAVGEDFAQLGVRQPKDLRCLQHPLTAYTSDHGREHFKPVSVDTRMWTFGEDMKGNNKPGWWAFADAPATSASSAPKSRPGDIAFQVETRQGYIQVEYLGSYKGVGVASTWLGGADGRNAHKCQLNGRWGDGSSLSKFTLLKTDTRGNHTIWFRGESLKFKIMGITSC